MDDNKLQIRFGGNADSLRKQITGQGFKYVKNEIQLCQDLADAITRLGMYDMLTDAEVSKARKRLFNQIVKYVK